MAKFSVSSIPARRAAQQVEQHRLQAVIGAGRIAGRRADAAIFLADQLARWTNARRRIVPQPVADMRVQPLGEALGQPVGQRLQQDVVIIVMIVCLNRSRCGSMPWIADREPADPILAVRGR